MTQTLEYHAGCGMFFLHYGDAARPYTMIQVWNLGVKEGDIRAALLNPNQEINLEESKL